MHYLIDGHNLIAQLPDISLEDPYDEAKLVLQLRSWAAAGRKRRITVIFDGGLPGGEWRLLSTGQIKVVFAAENTTADALLRRRVHQANDAGAHTLVSSDREVLAAAKSRRMPYITAELFAQRLADFRQRHEAEEIQPAVSSELEQSLTHEEVAEWLQLFEAAGPAIPANIDAGIQKSQEKKAAAAQDASAAEGKSGKSANLPTEEPGIIKSGTRKLNDDEVSEWLEIFGQGEDQSP